MELKLKPCPFCGNIPKSYIEYGSYGYSANKFSIKCDGCNAAMYLTDDYTDTDENIMVQLAERWNKRV
jgi:Lar family restriction alleviation protein